MTRTDHLAAEYALGLLEGEDLLRARGLAARDAEFAAAVARWQAQLAPLLDSVPAASPRVDLWPRIEATLRAEGATEPDANIIPLQRQLTRWKWTAGIASAAAAVALAFLAFPPTPPAPVHWVQPNLAAVVPIGETALSVDLIFEPALRRMYVTAAGLEADGVHDHELWLVPPEGAALSLGVVQPGAVKEVRLPGDLAEQIAEGSQLVLTREPLGGAVPGTGAGPVVANGQFTAI